MKSPFFDFLSFFNRFVLNDLNSYGNEPWLHRHQLLLLVPMESRFIAVAQVFIEYEHRNDRQLSEKKRKIDLKSIPIGSAKRAALRKRTPVIVMTGVPFSFEDLHVSGGPQINSKPISKTHHKGRGTILRKIRPHKHNKNRQNTSTIDTESYCYSVSIVQTNYINRRSFFWRVSSVLTIFKITPQLISKSLFYFTTPVLFLVTILLS